MRKLWNALAAFLILLSPQFAWAGPRELGAAVDASDEAAVARELASGTEIDALIPPFLLTPLQKAAIAGDLGMVRYLLNRGADPNTISTMGLDVLTVAVRSCRSDVPLVAALLEAGADVDHRLAAGLTPLMFAIEADRTDIALYLIESGANVDAVNDYGDGALNYAIYGRNPKVVTAVVDAGAGTAQLRHLFTTWISKAQGSGAVQPRSTLNCT